MRLQMAMVEAHVGGLSVIEIGRVLKLRPCSVHDILRKNQAIEPLEQRPAKTHDCNGTWLMSLHSHGLSLERWCIGWRFTVSEVLHALNGSENAEVHEALMRDFPQPYQKVFKTKPTWVLKIPHEKPEHATYIVKWDEVKKQYRANINDETDNTAGHAVEAFGISPELALSAMVVRLKEERRIRRLELAVEQYQGWANNFQAPS